jgi:hypothetical protein
MTDAPPEPTPRRRPLPRRFAEERDRAAQQAQDQLKLARDELVTLEKERRALATVPEPSEIQQARLADLALAIADQSARVRGLTRMAGLPRAYPSNPTRIFAGGLIEGGKADQPMRANRIYLDVTEATLDQVKEFWTIVEVAKDRGRELGLPAGKPRGAPRGPRKGGEVERWVRRGLETDDDTAYAEFKAYTIETEGSWTPKDYQWWRRCVRPRLLQKFR